VVNYLTVPSLGDLAQVSYHEIEIVQAAYGGSAERYDFVSFSSLLLRDFAIVDTFSLGVIVASSGLRAT
jgi:hypothetical protein